jgi:hypothetical protein
MHAAKVDLSVECLSMLVKGQQNIGGLDGEFGNLIFGAYIYLPPKRYQSSGLGTTDRLATME